MGAEPLPFQRWRSFKEAFAPELIERAASEMNGAVKHVLDPFGGSGTTALAAQFLGAKPTTIEVNPYLADLIQAKLAIYDIDRVKKAYVELIRRVSGAGKSRKKLFEGAPKTFIEPGVNGRFIFSKDVAQRILIYRTEIQTIDDPAIRRLFRVLLGAIVVLVSNVVISGKGRRYRRGWENKPASCEDLDHHFRHASELAIYDLHRYSARACREFEVIQGDARQLLTTVDIADLAVFSPPYPNSFDYTDVYNVELWSLGYLNNRESNLKLRNATLRSHVQIARNMDGTQYASLYLSKTLGKLNRIVDRLWNRRIPRMVFAYISDMGDVLSKVHNKLRHRGRIYMVVGDSRYGGVDVPVAAILAEIAPSLGFIVRRAEPCRSMRASPQQGGQPELAETLLVLEKR